MLESSTLMGASLKGTVMRCAPASQLIYTLFLIVCFSLCQPAAKGEAACVAVCKPKVEDNLVIHQFYLGCLSQASYLIADTDSKIAIVVDPQRDVEQYIEDAQKLGVRIKYVLLSHVHADFLAGHLELKRRTGAEICLGARARASFKFHALKDGDKLPLGSVVVQAIDTPGHTPEAISLLVMDGKGEGKADQKPVPYAVLTGDALFIGDVGRPDLLASTGFTAEALAAQLYHTLRERLMTLPDSTLVYPAHGAGSLCGRSLGKETVSTIGEQKASNYALQPMSETEFVKLITANQPTAPAYFSYDARVNLSNHKSLDQVVSKSKRPLEMEEVLRLKNGGAQVLDSREADDFAARYLIDSINVPLSGRFALYAGMVLSHDAPIVVVAPKGKEEQTIVRLGRIGFDNVIGFTRGGISAFEKNDKLLSSVPRTDAKKLSDVLCTNEAPLVLDVRNDGEIKEASIPHTVNIPLSELPRRFSEVPRNRPIVIECATGCRSSVAASLMRREGYNNVTDLAGGIEAWKKAGLPVIGKSPAAAPVAK